MPTYSPEFEKKKESVNALIKSLKNKEDYNILQAVYSDTNIVDEFYIKEKLDKVNLTYFTGMNQSELLNHFTKDIFNNKGERYYEELFQEIYNRQSKNNGYEPRYLIDCSGEVGKANGFIRHGSNVLNINSGIIEKYKLIDQYSNDISTKNANTIGAHTLLTLIHETQHTFQCEGLMNFVLGLDKNNPHDRARNAISLARMSLINYLHSPTTDLRDPDVRELADLIRQNYAYDYMEHDSNMAPIRFLKNELINGTLPSDVFLQAGMQRVIRDIHIDKASWEGEIPTLLDERATKMESIINGYHKFFEKYMVDGPIKKDVCSVLKDYLKTDELGMSKFRTDLNSDFNMCLNFIEYTKTNTVSNYENNTNEYDKPKTLVKILRKTRNFNDEENSNIA
ncbi:MAG: hypothetical protein IJW82_03215 [Clostridia bacterium]|nr:hypothetical protein [Clostridia bacterium]